MAAVASLRALDATKGPENTLVREGCKRGPDRRIFNKGLSVPVSPVLVGDPSGGSGYEGHDRGCDRGYRRHRARPDHRSPMQISRAGRKVHARQDLQADPTHARAFLTKRGRDAQGLLSPVLSFPRSEREQNANQGGARDGARDDLRSPEDDHQTHRAGRQPGRFSRPLHNRIWPDSRRAPDKSAGDAAH